MDGFRGRAEEEAFLHRIEHDPEDQIARLIYADWLEEEGPESELRDRRVELIRITYTYGGGYDETPPYTDDCWQIKPRRAELIGLVGEEWLSRMRYACRTVFRHGIPDGWRERWRLIRDFIERWHNIPMTDVGGQLQEIRATERRLGRVLPPSVREWVAFACDVWRWDVAQILDHQYVMEQLPNHPAVPLLRNPAGDYQWSIRHEDLWQDDPPVYGYYMNCSNGSNGAATYVQDESVTVTPLTEFILSYAICHARGWGGFAIEVMDPGHLSRELRAEGLFPGRARLGNWELFETEGIRVSLLSAPGRCKWMEVSVSRCLPRSYVPDFLVRYSQLPMARRYGGWNYD